MTVMLMAVVLFQQFENRLKQCFYITIIRKILRTFFEQFKNYNGITLTETKLMLICRMLLHFGTVRKIYCVQNFP